MSGSWIPVISQGRRGKSRGIAHGTIGRIGRDGSGGSKCGNFGVGNCKKRFELKTPLVAKFELAVLQVARKEGSIRLMAHSQTFFSRLLYSLERVHIIIALCTKLNEIKKNLT